LLALPVEKVAADGVIVYDPTVFGIDGLPPQSYVAPDSASGLTNEPTVTLTLGVGSVPFTTFDLFPALIVIARGAIVNVTEFDPAFQLLFPEWFAVIVQLP
jgi:hypothetical protein